MLFLCTHPPQEEEKMSEELKMLSIVIVAIIFLANNIRLMLRIDRAENRQKEWKIAKVAIRNSVIAIIIVICLYLL